MFKAIQHIIATTYNANHTVLQPSTVIVKESTPLLLDLSAHSESNSKLPQLENTLLVSSAISSLATLSIFPYILPPKYTLYLHKAIASVQNTLINSRSSPSTPNELVHGTKPKYRIFPFGACCMVTQHLDKRLALPTWKQKLKSEFTWGSTKSPEELSSF